MHSHTPPATDPPLLAAVDPSIGHLGFSVMVPSRKQVLSVASLEQVSSSEIDYHTRAGWMADALRLNLGIYAQENNQMDCVVEVPTNWFGHRGETSKDNEAVQKLYFTTGCILATLKVCPFIHSLWCITPTQWKGQESKDVTTRRAYRDIHNYQQSINADTNPSHDALEAFLLLHRSAYHWNAETRQFAPPYTRFAGHAIPISSFNVTEHLFNAP